MGDANQRGFARERGGGVRRPLAGAPPHERMRLACLMLRARAAFTDLQIFREFSQ